MNAHVLLNLLNELSKRDKYEFCRSFFLLLAPSVIKLKHGCYILFII